MDLLTLICKVCGHEWIPRQQEPKACPKCHSYKWDTGTNVGRKAD